MGAVIKRPSCSSGSQSNQLQFEGVAKRPAAEKEQEKGEDDEEDGKLEEDDENETKELSKKKSASAETLKTGKFMLQEAEKTEKLMLQEPEQHLQNTNANRALQSALKQIQQKQLVVDNHLHGISSTDANNVSQLDKMLMEQLGVELSAAKTKLGEAEAEVTRMIIGCQDVEHVTDKVIYMSKLATDMQDLKQLEDN